MSGPAVMADRVAAFLRFAGEHPELRFLVTPIGTGIAGRAAADVAPLFADAPADVVLPPEFADLLEGRRMPRRSGQARPRDAPTGVSSEHRTPVRAFVEAIRGALATCGRSTA